MEGYFENKHPLLSRCLSIITNNQTISTKNGCTNALEHKTTCTQWLFSFEKNNPSCKPVISRDVRGRARAHARTHARLAPVPCIPIRVCSVLLLLLDSYYRPDVTSAIYSECGPDYRLVTKSSELPQIVDGKSTGELDTAGVFIFFYISYHHTTQHTHESLCVECT